MKPQHQLRRIKASGWIYDWLIRFYPAPFRETFGQSMRQVFHAQYLDTIERKGNRGLTVLWLRTLLDFAWTCPKEQVFALPALPQRFWEQLIRKPVWHFPALVTIAGFLGATVVASRLPQYHSSTALLMVRVGEYSTVLPGTAIKLAGHLGLVDYEKPNSKAVLNPVIEELDLQTVYQKRLGTPIPPSKEETYKLLFSRVAFHQSLRSSVIRITVHDEDKRFAKTLAEALVEQYRRHMAASNMTGPTAQTDPNNPPILVLDYPEESAQLVRPQFRGGVLLGGKISLAVGGAAFAAMLLQRWRTRRSIGLSPN